MALTSVAHREEYLKRKRTTLIIRVSLFFFIVCILIAGTSFIAHRQSIRITSVEVVGGILVTQNDVQNVVDSTFAGSYLFLYPKNNALIYPHDLLVTHLKDNLKRIDTIEVKLKNPHTLSVIITERKPVALWCGEIQNTSDNCFFIDDTSTLFADAPDFSGDAYFKFYGSLSTTSVQTSQTLPESAQFLGNEYIASTTLFTDISKFISEVRELNLHPQYLSRKDAGEFTLVIGSSSKIYFDTQEPLSKISDNLRVLLKSPPFAGTTTGNTTIDYIDLRFGNKVYYKLK